MNVTMSQPAEKGERFPTRDLRYSHCIYRKMCVIARPFQVSGLRDMQRARIRTTLKRYIFVQLNPADTFLV